MKSLQGLKRELFAASRAGAESPRLLKNRVIRKFPVDEQENVYFVMPYFPALVNKLPPTFGEGILPDPLVAQALLPVLRVW